MSADPSPIVVAERLERLRASYVPMTTDDARRLLAAPARSEPFAASVARRMAELRALLDLTSHLYRGRRVDAPPPRPTIAGGRDRPVSRHARAGMIFAETGVMPRRRRSRTPVR